MPQGEDSLDSLKTTVNSSLDWGTKNIRQADKSLTASGVTPVGGMAIAAGTIGAAALLHHLLSQRDHTSNVR